MFYLWSVVGGIAVTTVIPPSGVVEPGLREEATRPMEGDAEREARRCRGVTREGRPCRRRAGDAHFCRVHATPAFYARALQPAEQEHYAEALTQEGLSAEIAVLRLHLLRLIERGDEERPGEIPRTVHALIRALHGQAGKDDAADEASAALDAAVRAEGLRLLDEGISDAPRAVESTRA